MALAPYLGDDDIVIGSIHEILDAGYPLNRAAKTAIFRPVSLLNVAGAILCGKKINEALNIGVKSHYRGRLSQNPPHPTAVEMSKFFEKEWNSYFKFAFVRNPYEQAISDYHWRRKSTGVHISFREYLIELLQGSNAANKLAHANSVSNLDMVAIDNEIVVDRLGRYEDLESDFSEVASYLNLRDASLGKRQKRGMKNVGLASFYGSEELQIAGELFAREMECFDYTVPDELRGTVA